MHVIAIILIHNIKDDHSKQDELSLKGSFKYLLNNKKVTSYFMSFNLFCFCDIPFDIFALVILANGKISTGNVALGLSLSTTLSIFGSFISVEIIDKYYQRFIYSAPVMSLLILLLAVLTNNKVIL